ncbi:MAG: DUF2178 domain-containing protein [Nanohaloarchaea archaeon]|nr:DUF2178 domain-containing protein [Candidatus Nanohaloarchaea archaeon]
MRMNLEKYGLTPRKTYFLVLITGMILSVITFNMEMELLAAGIIVGSVMLLSLVKRSAERPVFDERDISLAEESTHQAVMFTGALGGVFMIIVSIGMGLGKWGYPDWAAPYFLTWGGIVGLAALIEASKRLRGVK